MTTSTTTKKTDAEAAAAPFTFGAWLGTGSKPRRYVTLYAAGGVQAEIDAVDKDIEAAEAAAGDTFGGAAGTRELENRRAELQEQIESSKAVFLVQAVDQDAQLAIEKNHPLKDDMATEDQGRVILERWIEQVAAQVIGFGPSRDSVQDASLTVEQVRELRATLGVVEYDRLLSACMECMSEVSAGRPFWRSNSGNNRVL